MFFAGAGWDAGPLDVPAQWPVVGPLFAGPLWLVGLKLAGVVVGLWIVVAVLRRFAGDGGERKVARQARRLVAEGRWEQAGDLHVTNGNLQAAVHMFEQAGAWAKAARVAERLGQEARARQFLARAGGVAPSPSASVAPRPAAGPEAPPRAAPEPEVRKAEPARRPATSAEPAANAASGAKAPGAPAGLRTRVLSRPAMTAIGATKQAAQQSQLPDGGERYEILGELGRGGMAVVYRAKDRLLGRPVALKFLVLAPGHTADVVDMFLREARAAAALNHPSIVTVYDLGRMNGKPFIAMELIEGEDALRMLERGGPFGVGETVWVVVQAATALEFAHQRGLVHRDVKPANLMISVEGQLKVMDFGLAVLARRHRGEKMISGTPAYMSPEQLLGLPLDARSDVFGLAVSAYELLTGRLPFEEFVRDVPPAPPSTVRSDVPPELDAPLLAGLAPDPTERPSSVAEFASRLRAAYDRSRAKAEAT
jgi:hypothetical protein